MTDKGRNHKVFDKFYINKKGEITEHVSARGGIYRIRMSNWKAIKGCKSLEEIQKLIGKFKSEMKNLDKKKDSALITEWRTAITMAGDYYHPLKHFIKTDPDRYVGNPPLTNTVEETDEHGEIQKSEDEEGSAIESEPKPTDTTTPSKRIKKGIERDRGKDTGVKGYRAGRKVIGEGEEVELPPSDEKIPWYHRYVENRTEENREKLMTPNLTITYKKWRYGYGKRKRKK